MLRVVGPLCFANVEHIKDSLAEHEVGTHCFVSLHSSITPTIHPSMAAAALSHDSTEVQCKLPFHRQQSPSLQGHDLVCQLCIMLRSDNVGVEQQCLVS